MNNTNTTNTRNYTDATSDNLKLTLRRLKLQQIFTMFLKALRETQTLGCGCSKSSENFSPCCRPLSRGTWQPKFNQLEMVTAFTYRTQFGEDQCTQFWVIVVTDPHTNTHPQTGPITIHCAAASAQCNKLRKVLIYNDSYYK